MILTKKINLSVVAIGLVLASMFLFGIALAQTTTTTDKTQNETTATTDISPELIPLAKELNCQTSAECAEKFDSNLETSITLAQKYKIYTPDQEKVATTFKTEVLERLKTVSQDNFEEEILALANKILKEKPSLAKTMGVTRQGVDAAVTITNTVKEAGTDIRTCQKSPEDLSREELIACVKASNNLSNKEKVVGDYIPKENAKAEEMKRMLDLEDSLLSGEYPGLGKINVEQAGQICLKPGSEAIADCDRIAQRFFGAEGLNHLKEARKQTTRIKEYYTEGIERMELITPDGQKLIGKGAIKNACNSAFEGNNLGLARACGNFAVKNGYATEEEIEDGLKLLENFSQKAEGVDFDDCRFNPESCKEFLPDEFREQFDSQFEIFRIMSESIGFDPSRCENSYDADIGKRCLEGAKKALSRVEEIAQKSPEARRIVNEIKSHIAEGERMTERLDEFHEDSERGGMTGPGGCRGPEECYKYCSQPANSAECISFGAKSQIFDQNTVVERFNVVNKRNEGFDYRSFPNLPDSSGRFVEDQRFDQYPKYPYQPWQPDVDPGFNRYPYPDRPVGPSPECFAAIQSGDFAKAKTVCSSVTENYPKPIAEPFPVCPAYSMPSPCPEGQMRQQASDARGCLAYGACTPIENYKPIDIPKPCPAGTYWDGNSCINQTTTKECPAGMWWDGVTQNCKSSMTPTVGSCDYSTQYWKASTSQCLPQTNCYDTTKSDYNSMECQGVRGAITPVGNCTSSQYWNGTACVSSASSTWSNKTWTFKDGTTQFSSILSRTDSDYTTYINGVESDCRTKYFAGWKSGAGDQTNWQSFGVPECSTIATTTNSNSCTANQYWNGSACVSSSMNSTPQCSDGKDNDSDGAIDYPADTGCYGMDDWDEAYAATTTPYPSSGTCPTGYHSHGDSGGYCMNDQENYSGTCYNSAGTSVIACPQMTYTSPCPAGQYWYTPPGGGAGYCQTSTTYSSDAATATGCAQAGGTWNSSTSYCQMPTCPSGQYWYTPPSGGAGYCMSNTTSSTTCSSGQYWNGTACVATSTTDCTGGQYWNGSACVANSTTYTTDPSAACAQGGGTWNSSTNYCQMPTTTSSTSCGSGQWWDGTTCQNITTSSGTACSSDQYWNGTACVANSSTTAPSYPAYPSYPSSSDPAIGCAEAGGTWTGSTCQMAQNISDRDAYYSYFEKDNALLAQVVRAFTNLFK